MRALALDGKIPVNRQSVEDSHDSLTYDFADVSKMENDSIAVTSITFKFGDTEKKYAYMGPVGSFKDEDE